MDLRNWEFFEADGNPVVGASVKVRDAVLSHPNGGTILATTTTDSNGMWAFTGLSDTAKDVEVIWGSSSQYHRWYKGMTRHDLGTVFMDEAARFRQVATPSAPGSGATLLYSKTGGALYRRADAAAEVKMADFESATAVLRASGWGQIQTADVANGAITSDKVSLSTAEAFLGTDVNLNNTANYFDGPSVSLAAGTWLLVGGVLVANSAASAEIIAKLWDGTTIEDVGEVLTTAANQYSRIPLFGIVSPGGTTTYKISVRDVFSTSGVIKAGTVTSAGSNTASSLRAVRIA